MKAITSEDIAPRLHAGTIETLIYRPDIDGLRAFAVSAVLLFHAFPGMLPGGFAGVDLFFVISGFLITRILCAEFQTGRYSIGGFYARRIRRIFPTLALVLIASYAIGWFCLYGDEYKQLGKHMLAGAAFASNWTLWSEAGYFDQSAETKPLLHLWSLGVEEQFYIVWPLLLAFVVRRKSLMTWVAIAAAISFFFDIWLLQRHASAAFFLPFGRFWELLAGAALAIAPRAAVSGSGVSSKAASHAFSLIGLLFCAASFLFLNSRLNFPGWWALLPVLGAVSLIAAGPTGWVNRRVLAHPGVVWIGKISYPLYLWHWPLLSFAAIVAGNTVLPSVRIGIVAVSVMLAWLTTVVVERPIRLGKPHRAKIVVPCVLMLLVAYLGGMTYARDGLGFRKGYSPNADVTTAKLGAGHEFVTDSCGIGKANKGLFEFCATDKRAPSRYALWGDSKADALYWGLVRTSPAGESWTLIARASCAPMDGIQRISTNPGSDAEACRRADQIALQTLVDNREITTVVLGIAARDLVGPSARFDPGAALNGLDHSIDALQHAGKRVALVLDNPTLPDPRRCMDRKPTSWPIVRRALGISNVSASDRCAISYSTYLSRTASYHALIEQLKQRHPELIMFDPTPVLCDIRHGVCPMTMNGKYLYSYSDHISDYANGRIATQLLPLLSR